MHQPLKPTAGVLLFAAFTYALEIPLGGLAWAVVLTRHRHRPHRFTRSPS